MIYYAVMRSVIRNPNPTASSPTVSLKDEAFADFIHENGW
jgi:hypothetical protein